MRGLDDDGDAAAAAGDEAGSVEHDPGAVTREHPRGRDLPWLAGVVSGPERDANPAYNGAEIHAKPR